MEGPDVRFGVMWVFTIGEPPQDLMDGFLRLTAMGSTDWVLIPIMNHLHGTFPDSEYVSVGLND